MVGFFSYADGAIGAVYGFDLIYALFLEKKLIAVFVFPPGF